MSDAILVTGEDLEMYAENAAFGAQTNAVGWVIKVIDEHHLRADPKDDSTYKGIKNFIRDGYMSETGIDPAPGYPIHNDLQKSAPGWKHYNCTLEQRQVGAPPFITFETWCKNHNERIVSIPR